MDHKKIDTLQLVRGVTSEQMKIKSKFFLLGTWVSLNHVVCDTIHCPEKGYH